VLKVSKSKFQNYEVGYGQAVKRGESPMPLNIVNKIITNNYFFSIIKRISPYLIFEGNPPFTPTPD
jgi:hypothetical protein